jgi:phosphotriesterase-related protein
MSRIETVCGPIKPEDMGITFVHEHIFLDIFTTWSKRRADNLENMEPTEYQQNSHSTKDFFLDLPIKLDFIGKMKKGEIRIKENEILDDEELMSKEILEFKKFGGGTLIEQSMPGIGRDPVALKTISNATGINIVASTGWYNWWSHPPYVKRKTADELSQIMIKDLTEGIADTGIKAGGIGECACTVPTPFHSEEQKVLIAAFKAQSQTGCPFTLHPAKFDPAKQGRLIQAGELYLDMIEKEDADKSKFYLSHADWFSWDLKYLMRLMDRGANLAFDTFGMSSDVNRPRPYRPPEDYERVSDLVSLCNNGYEKQLLLSHDVCSRLQLKKYGGWGYSHILEHIVPDLRYYGIKEKQIKTMLIDNPKRIFSY